MTNRTTWALLIGMMFFSCSPPGKKIPQKTGVHNQGVSIDYTDNSTGDTTLLFVHGWCINKTYWNDQVAYFGKRYRVVAIDLPGYGQSGKNRNEWNVFAFAKDVDSVMVQLKLKNVILVGHSMSGDIVLQAAINLPNNVIGMVGIDNFKGVGVIDKDSVKSKAAYDAAIAAMRHSFKATAFDYAKQYLFYKTTTGSVKTKVLNDIAKADTIIATKSLEPNNFNEAVKLKQLNKKLYLINSDYYPTYTSGLAALSIPYKVFYIHATGHFPMIEKPKEFNIALQHVIADIGKN